MKMTKKWLMIAAALLLVGLTLVLSVLAFYWGDWTAFNTVEPMEPVNQSIAGGEVTKLQVELDSEDVRLVHTEGDSFHVQWYEGSSPRCQLELGEDGTLKIEQTSFSGPLVQIDFSSVSRALLIEVPASFAGTTELTNAAGDIAIRDLDLPGDLHCNSTSGSVDLRDVRVAGDLEAETVSGEIQALGASASGTMTMISTAGDQQITRLQAQNLYLHSASGQMALGQIQISDNLTIETTSGDITWQDLDAEQIQISTTSGEVEGVLSGRYQVAAESVYGEIDVTDAAMGSRLASIQTVSGDITIMQ